MSVPVFYDPQRRRWRRFRLLAQVGAAALALVFCGLALSVLINPSLPALSLASARSSSPQAHQPAPPQPASAEPSPTPPPTFTATPPPTATPVPTATSRPQRLVSATTAALKSARLDRAADLLRACQTPQPGGRRDELCARLRATATAMAVRTPSPASTTVPPSKPRPPSSRPAARPTRTPIAVPQPSIKPGSTARPLVLGFYVNWDDTSRSSLQENITRLDRLIPEWLHLGEADGTLIADDPAREAQVLKTIREHRPDLPVLPLVNNYNDRIQAWDDARLSRLLGDPSLRGRAVQGLLDYVRGSGSAGICVDFENVSPRNRDDLAAFMRELYAAFHPLGLEVAQAVPADDPSFDYPALAQATDYLILMAYDEHWSGDEPGPVASQPWFADTLRRRLAEAGPDEYVIALGAYGYDWPAGGGAGRELSFQGAVRTAELSGAHIRFDAIALNPTFDYVDANGQLHHVWFLDAVTAFNQVVEAQRYRPRGYALWRLGAEDPSVWQVFDRRTGLDRSAADALRVVRYGYDLDYEGLGEVLRVDATPRDGARELAYDDRSGWIRDEQLAAYPSPYVVLRWGGENAQKIALTFDDGPNPLYTSAILDILHRYNVPATFFVIGSSAGMNAALVERMVAEGHEVGNHTFTHPDIAAITPEQFVIELNATERLFESQIGRHSLLFRPPYGEDVEPDRPDQIAPLALTSDLGYYTVGMGIDPKDWRNPGVDAIVQETLAQAESGEGNIVLLHDGGGDRSQTVAALPRIVEGLRERGYELVTVSNLLGLTREDVMPPISGRERVIAGVNEAGFSLLGTLGGLAANLFVFGIVLGVLRVLAVGALAAGGWWKARHMEFPPDYRPPVAAVVPAYNEEKVICQTVDALLASDYSQLEIIVVDDGSGDGTYRRALERYANEPRVRVFNKPNGGKAQALNFGIRQTQAEVVVAQDADTIIMPDAVGKLVRYFADARVGAVAGNAKVGNRVNPLTEWQALEYVTSQNLDRRAFALLNCITVVPGAIGAWRRDALLRAGGFHDDTLAEDAALTLALLRLGYRIDYEDGAVGLTEAPDGVRGFVKQRFRWMYGTLQAAWQNRDTLLRPRYGSLGCFALPYIFVFHVLFPLIAPVVDLLAAGSLAALVWQRAQHPADPAAYAPDILLAYYALFLAVDFLSALLAFALERKEDWSLLCWLFVQRLAHRHLMYYVATKAVLTALKGPLVGWGKLERKATVAW